MAPEKTDLEESNTSTVTEDGGGSVSAGGDDTTHHDPYFEPVVSLPEVTVRTHEEEEDEMVRLRCKLFRYHTGGSPGEWKERGTGDVKILKNSSKKTVRLLMRQDKTLKVRANHYITPYMDLKPNCGSDRAWVWSVVADFADEEPKQELFAIRFANTENARLFKEAFDEARGIVTVVQMKMKEEEEKWKTSQAEEEEEEEEEEGEEKEKKKNKEKSTEKDKPESKKEAAMTDQVTKNLEKMSVKTEAVKE